MANIELLGILALGGIWQASDIFLPERAEKEAMLSDYHSTATK
jgi:hypothetical protein